MRIPPARPPQPVFTLRAFVVGSSTSRRRRSRASSPRRACRPSSGGPCCTCRTAAGWATTTAPPRPTGSTAAPPRSTTSSPPRVRRTGGLSTGLKEPPPLTSPQTVRAGRRGDSELRHVARGFAVLAQVGPACASPLAAAAARGFRFSGWPSYFCEPDVPGMPSRGPNSTKRRKHLLWTRTTRDILKVRGQFLSSQLRNYLKT